MSQSNKRVKHNQVKSTALIEGDIEDVSPATVALVIRNNHVIHMINQLNSLTYLKTINTSIASITKCKWLTTVFIDNNSKIKQLANLPKLEDIQCANCPQLSRIRMKAAGCISISACNQLQLVHAPLAESCTIRDCLEFKTMTFGPNLVQLSLLNCEGLTQLNLPNAPNLEHLNLINCSQLQLAGSIIKCKFLTIRSCDSIVHLGPDIQVESIQIELCDGLTNVMKLVATSCIISKCSNLRRIKDVQIGKLLLDYCYSIPAINTKGIAELNINCCIGLKEIVLHKDTKKTLLVDCYSLQHIQTRPLSQGELRDQSITLNGRFALEEIRNMYVSELTITNNNQIYYIDTIHDLTSLTLYNCSELESVSKAVISKELSIKNCKNLQTITDIVAPKTITLSCLPILSITKILFAPARIVFIENCPNLTCTFTGQWIQELTLINTNLISIINIRPSADIMVFNSNYLPNTDQIDCLIAAIDSRSNALKTIIGSIRNHFIKHLRRRLQAALNETNCAICLMDIDRSQRFMTKCFHTYHTECIYRWTAIRNSCPICNMPDLY